MPTSPASSTVLGYFNPHSFNVSIASEQLGINVVVPGKQYLTDREGRKINDERLDSFARGGLLVKEFSPTPVPRVVLRTTVVPVSAATAVAVRAPVAGTILPPGGKVQLPQPSVPPGQPPSGAPSVGAMTIEQAQRQGLIARPPADRFDRAPNEDGDGAAARGAPYIDQLGGGRRKVPAVSVPVPVPQVLPDAAKVAAIDPDSPDVITETMRVAAADAGVSLPAAEQAAEPTAAEPAAGRPEAPVKATRRFVNYDDRAFSTPGDLRKYMRRKFKDNELAEEALQPLLPQFKAP